MQRLFQIITLNKYLTKQIYFALFEELEGIKYRISGKKESTEKKSRRKEKEGGGEEGEEEVEKMESMVLDGEEEENKQGQI